MRRLLQPRGRVGLPFGGVALLLLASLTCLAQRYSFREYTQGLGNLNIAGLVQDRTGFLWVGTQNGLYRYDGSQFQGYGEEQGLPDRMIQTLFVSPDGTLWVASSTSIFFQQRNGKFAEIEPAKPGDQFLPRAGTIFASNKPNEVVAVIKNGAILLRKTSEDHWVVEPIHLEGNNIESALYAADGALWYGCDSDLCRLAEGKTTRMRASLGLPEEEWTNLLLTRNGQIWIRGDLHTGEIDPQTLRFKAHDLPGASALASEAYPVLVEDAQGRILTPQGPSLAMWEKDRWRMVTERNGLSRFEIQDLFVDREGSVWISVVGHGLKRWVGQDRWEGYTAADGLSDDLVWAALRDRKGRLWVGTESGVDLIPAGQTTPRPWSQAGITTTRAVGLAESADGAVWTGSAAGALVRIDGNTLHATQWKVPETYNIGIDGRQNIWAATSTGLYELNADWRHSTPARADEAVFGNTRQRFSDVCSDSLGRVWATGEQGLFVRDGGGWHKIDLGSAGSNFDVVAIDQRGYVWAAGASQDLARLKIEGYRVTEAKHIGRPPLLVAAGGFADGGSPGMAVGRAGCGPERVRWPQLAELHAGRRACSGMTPTVSRSPKTRTNRSGSEHRAA